jgi:sarcosine oxidase
MARADRTEIVVVGAGLLGLATARSLRRRGHDVVVLEQATVGHPRGGSHGPTRIFRLGYPARVYVELALAALDEWRDLEAETGEHLLETTGQLSLGDELAAMFSLMVDAGAPVEWMSAADARAAFPDFAIDGPALFEPASGVLLADRCLAALRAAADCDVREHEPVSRITDEGTHVAVDTDTARLHADVVVVAAGPWSASMLGRVAPVRTFATLEHVAYVRPRHGPLPTLPVFIAHERPAAYGLMTRALDGYKLALHHAGAVIDVERDPRDPDPRAVAQLEAVARRFLPRFEPQPVLVETCVYDNTPDEDFVLDRRGRIVVGAGTSGHGFKFGPLLGELLADLATGTPPRFSLDTFSLDRQSLRTAAADRAADRRG